MYFGGIHDGRNSGGMWRFCPGTGDYGSQDKSRESAAADGQDKKNQKDGNGDITLTLWHIENDAKRLEVVKRCIERFEASHPNVKVEQVPNGE